MYIHFLSLPYLSLVSKTPPLTSHIFSVLIHVMQGWTDASSPWPQVMQALSHFSYHITAGQYVLCDLQGGVYESTVILTDPVILSKTKEFGVTDLGPEGISSFFTTHICTRFCRKYWILPDNCKRHFKPEPGTIMIDCD